MNMHHAPRVALVAKPQVLQALGVSNSTLYKLIRESAFPRPIKIGRCSRWTSNAVADFVAKALRDGFEQVCKAEKEVPVES